MSSLLLEIKNILFVDNAVSDYQDFINFVNSDTYVIVYSSNSSKVDVLSFLQSNFETIDRIGFAFDIYNTTSFDNEPFFLPTYSQTEINNNEITQEEELVGVEVEHSENDKTYLGYNDNVHFIVGIIKDFNVKNIDYLACNTLNFLGWSEYYSYLTSETGVIVGASNDKTGNIKYGGNWTMENTGENIEFIYFTQGIEYHTYLLGNLSSNTTIQFIDTVISKIQTSINLMLQDQQSINNTLGSNSSSTTINNYNQLLLNETLNIQCIVGTGSGGTYSMIGPTGPPYGLYTYNPVIGGTSSIAASLSLLLSITNPDANTNTLISNAVSDINIFGIIVQQCNSALSKVSKMQVDVLSSQTSIASMATIINTQVATLNVAYKIAYNTLAIVSGVDPTTNEPLTTEQIAQTSADITSLNAIIINLTSLLCFPFDTPIKTDQGFVSIQKILPGYHTIDNKRIIAIPRIASSKENAMVCFDKHALAYNKPYEKTVMSKEHKLMYNGKMVKADDFLTEEFCGRVYLVPYNGEEVYNILMDNYDVVNVNNLLCETLDPKNTLSIMYRAFQYVTPQDRLEIIEKFNSLYLKSLETKISNFI